MRRNPRILAFPTASSILIGLVLCVSSGREAAAQQAPAPEGAELDVKALFTTTCGWCHSDGGRAAGKGPQLMNSARTDDFMKNRIKNGKEGAMPAFGGTFDDSQIDTIVKYIRSLKPDQG
ncbi:MAG: cytochrome c [Hyphomicrobiales bacterium]|nr:cytochrome c [Hyphomicrobiales bacterium]MBV8769658.1 cytochrome c [Hyphomicrobiales bacterium]MBV9051244.1 cytochrome c [Hyphomicrobiales bacterium]MBV9139168.1 cytochrome c [Hyphomicrobiales bacterium]MBV9591566.1 cytochrome c [Hyphomicrobiales bacterium]